MFFRTLRKIMFVVPVIALALSGCRGESGDDTYRNEQIARLLKEGKSLLTKNQWGLARETFSAVLTCDTDGDGKDDLDADCGLDSGNSEARFGIVLADLLSFTDTIRLVSSLVDGFSAASASAEENKFVNQLITDLIHDLRAKFITIDQNLLLVEGNPGHKFRIDDLPIYLSNSSEPDLNLKGEWDRADAFLINALVKGVIGALDYADSIDLQLDVLRAYDYFSQSSFDMDRLDHLESLITYILNDPNYPNFLSVKKEDGNDLVISAASNFGQAVYNFQAALYMASIESDDQSDDILQYVDANKNGRYDPPIDRESDKCAHLAEVMADTSEDRVKPENFKIFDSTLGSTDKLPYLSEQTACLLQKAYHSLAWDEIKDTQDNYEAAPRINFLADMVPLLDSVVAGIFENMDTSGDDVVADLAPLIGTQGLLTILVNDLLGDALEFDLHAFFSVNDSGKAGNIRGLLPVWENNACGAGVCLNDFVIEMECSDGAALPAPLTDVFPELDLPACKKAWTTEDTGHFSAYAAELEAAGESPIDKDGFVGYLPYIAFQDASLHGLLWLNLAAVADTFSGSTPEAKSVNAGLSALDGNNKDFAKASLTDLNAFIAALSANGTIKGLIVK